MKKRILSVLLENESGALSRIVGLFSQRGYNIDSLAVAATDDASLSRLTIQTVADDKALEQIEKHLHKLIDVLRVSELTQAAYVEREVMLVKVRINPASLSAIKNAIDIFRGQVIDLTANLYTIQLTGVAEKLTAFLQVLQEVTEIVEIVRSGVIALSRGDKSI